MNELDIIDEVRNAQDSANLDRRPYSVCAYHTGLIVMLKKKAVELGYNIIETCNPILVKNL
jgi:hypothetical protein